MPTPKISSLTRSLHLIACSPGQASKKRRPVNSSMSLILAVFSNRYSSIVCKWSDLIDLINQLINQLSDQIINQSYHLRSIEALGLVGEEVRVHAQHAFPIATSRIIIIPLSVGTHNNNHEDVRGYSRATMPPQLRLCNILKIFEHTYLWYGSHTGPVSRIAVSNASICPDIALNLEKKIIFKCPKIDNSHLKAPAKTSPTKSAVVSICCRKICRLTGVMVEKVMPIAVRSIYAALACSQVLQVF